MSTQTLLNLPFQASTSLRRMRAEEYDKLVELGMLTDTDQVELLDGDVVQKMPRNPTHDGSLLALSRRLTRLLPDGWLLRGRSAAPISRDPNPISPSFAVRNERTSSSTQSPPILR